MTYRTITPSTLLITKDDLRALVGRLTGREEQHAIRALKLQAESVWLHLDDEASARTVKRAILVLQIEDVLALGTLKIASSDKREFAERLVAAIP